MLGGGTDRLLGLPSWAGNLRHLGGEVALLLLGHRRHKVASTARLEDLSNLLALLSTKTDSTSNRIDVCASRKQNTVDIQHAAMEFERGGVMSCGSRAGE